MSFFSELTTKKYWIISAIVLIGVLFALYFLVSFTNEAREEKLAELDNNIKEQLGEDAVSLEVLSVVLGTIEEIEGNIVYLNVYEELLSEFPQISEKRVITVGAETEIVRRISKNNKYYQQEFAQYQEDLEKVLEEQNIPINEFNLRPDGNYGFAVPEFPHPYQETVLSLNDLNPGDLVSVEGEGNVMVSEEFEAILIIKHL